MSTAEEIKARIGDRRVIASVSGGKDSAAMSLYLKELDIEHDRVFMDTQFEHESTYTYLRGELTQVIGPITEIRGELGMVALIRKKGMFPGRLHRFCTQELKVFPMQRYLASLDTDAINTVGIRGEESATRKKMPEWEWSTGFDCEVWRPLIDWTLQDVVDIHRRHNLSPSPLYTVAGASRLGCWPCIYARKDEIRLVAEIDPERIAEIAALEVELDEAAHARAAAKGVEVKRRPTFFSRPIFADENGHTPIANAVAWSKTAHGGKQFEEFQDPSEEGCMRWGLCDTSSEEPTE
jgi:3'-phosphoadenosine 5'-phosphosulfate sulfotransferase (PAPS reductase)/FAD synthetase